MSQASNSLDSDGGRPSTRDGEVAPGMAGGTVTLSDAGFSAPPSIDAEAQAGAFVPPGDPQLVDDMLDVQPDGPGISGRWGTYSDRAVSWSEPPIFTSDSGLLVPVDGTPVSTLTNGGPYYRGGPQPYRRFYGAGETRWGAGLGLNFADAPPDGGALAMNACGARIIFDVDALVGDSLVQQAFDGSTWTGIQFWAKSLNGVARSVTLIVQDDQSNPFGALAGASGCDVCASGNVGGCGDGPRVVVVFSPEWTHLQVPFGGLHPNGWSGTDVSRTPDLGALYSLNFEVEDVPLPPFNLGIAYVEFYD